MLETVDVGTQDLNLYERSAGAEAVAQLRELAAPLEGARIVHVNATPYGGGVAEILRSEIPLLRDLGILADWKLITGDQTFFSVTEAIHNGLQGAPRELTPAEQETYLTHAARNAQLLEEEYDLVVVHDPQPLPLLKLHGKGAARWVWRCHIDTSEPNPQIWDFLRPYLEGFRSARRRGGRSLLLPGEKFLGALTAALGGLDALVFTGGIGEHSATVRERICEGLGFLGIRPDPDRNAEHAPVISRDGDPVTVRVIPTDENLMVARHTRQLITPTPKEGA